MLLIDMAVRYRKARAFSLAPDTIVILDELTAMTGIPRSRLIDKAVYRMNKRRFERLMK